MVVSFKCAELRLKKTYAVRIRGPSDAAHFVADCACNCCMHLQTSRCCLSALPLACSNTVRHVLKMKIIIYHQQCHRNLCRFRCSDWRHLRTGRANNAACSTLRPSSWNRIFPSWWLGQCSLWPPNIQWRCKNSVSSKSTKNNFYTNQDAGTEQLKCIIMLVHQIHKTAHHQKTN